MSITNAVVEAVSSKEVTTKFGAKKTYSIKLRGGDWYSCGFTDPKVHKDDVVSFEYEETTYGKQVTPKTLTKSTGVSATVVESKPAYGSKGVFPIPLLDGSRAIVRQNALTNAREFHAKSFGDKPFTYNVDTSAEHIINLARKFEAYTTGDLDMLQATEEFNAEHK